VTAKTVEPPSMLAPMGSSAAASCSIAAIVFTAYGPPPFICVVFFFLAVLVMSLSSVYLWVDYSRKYIDFRIRKLTPSIEES